MNFTIEKTKAWNALLLVVLFFVLQLAFSLVIDDLYVFEKAAISADLIYEFNFIRFFIAFLVVLLFVTGITVIRMKGFLYMILVLVSLFFVFPSAILFANVQNIDGRIFLSHSILFATIIGIGLIKIKLPFQTLAIHESRKTLFFIVLVGMIPFVILFLPYINLKNILLLEIYETRALMTAKVNNFYTNYTYSWFSKVLIPILFVFGLYFRNKLIILISFVSLIFLFLCGAHKAVFVGLIMVLLLYRFDYLKKANYLIKLVTVVAIVSLGVSLIFEDDFLMRMTIRRTMFLPSLLDILYFDFFDNNYIYWSESLPGLFFEYPYEYKHYYVIGDRYFGSKIWAANNGIVSDGFMNYGMAGVIINSLVVAIYFSLLNQLNISSKFFGVFFLLFFSIISSSFTTVMLSHGGLLLLLISFFILKGTAIKMK